jgi:hypothetical protein
MIDAIFISLSGTWICAGYGLACACTFSSEGARSVCASSVMPMNPKMVQRGMV